MRKLLLVVFCVLFVLVPTTANASTVVLGGAHPGEPATSCGPSTWIQEATGATPYTVPAGYGVITSWAVKIGSQAGGYQLKIVRTSAVLGTYPVIAQTDVQNLAASVPATRASFPVRMPVQPGDMLSLRTATANSSCLVPETTAQIHFSGPGSDPQPGTNVLLQGSGVSNTRLNVEATVESDGDGDGFGDDTQDQCPTDKTTQGPCPPDVTGPVISAVSATNAKFAVDSAASARKKKSAPPKGTTIRYSLSETATVTFSVDRKTTGRKKGDGCTKKTRKNRKKKHCTLYSKSGSFTQAGVAGANSKYFPGRIANKTLKPGTYRITLTAADAAKNAAKPASITVKIVKR